MCTSFHSCSLLTSTSFITQHQLLSPELQAYSSYQADPLPDELINVKHIWYASFWACLTGSTVYCPCALLLLLRIHGMRIKTNDPDLLCFNTNLSALLTD